MAIDKLRLLKIRLETMKKSLDDYSAGEKATHITQTMATRFNDTLSEIGIACPDIKDLLPSRITSSHPQSLVGKANATYMDLGMFIDEIIALVSEIESGE
ncbi:MAG: hypothetical protein CME33_19710 [Gimesia sp.]|uniref:hypothetical protein n=1 Tax=Gimesia sp. TaxID=2024833 RepID=UPI000C564218|nr:hypothetical protein [Gimesia sp.]MAX38790.1 hypothetical protein [Gimesia sp.]|tara:strand:- start:5315 stop:5614 length:300 start_codon:yes stop_codon:yes gene_type:complete